MLTVLGRHFHGAQQLVRTRATRNPNVLIERDATLGERIADVVAGFGGSWTFIITFAVVLLVYTGANRLLGARAWDPYPFILLNLALSFQAAYAAPFIMMSQNRQQDIDRREAENDHQINIKAELEIELLHQKVDSLRENEVVMLTKTINELTELLQRESKAAHEKRQGDAPAKAPAAAAVSRTRKKPGVEKV